MQTSSVVRGCLAKKRLCEARLPLWQLPAPQLVWESGGLCGPPRGPELPPVGKARPSAVPFCHHSPDVLLSLQAWLEPSERGRGFPESFASGILCAT